MYYDVFQLQIMKQYVSCIWSIQSQVTVGADEEAHHYQGVISAVI